jgi:DNA-binding PadR family transcriptional regulator
MREQDRFLMWFDRPVPGPHGRPWMPPFGGPPMRYARAGRRVRRGDVRAAILLLLEETPRNGYQLMQEIEQRSGGAWRPSPGSVYPALQLLVDEGLISGQTRDGGSLYELTEAGRAHVEEHRERLGVPWEQIGAELPPGVRELGRALAQLAGATRQVMDAGDEAQTAEAAKLLAETRRALYRILAAE